MILAFDKGPRSSELDRAGAALSGMGIGLKKVRCLHSKVVVADEGLLAMGSFNWLSADRADTFARHEISLVYRRPHLAGEIDVLVESLDRRVTAD